MTVTKSFLSVLTVAAFLWISASDAKADIAMTQFAESVKIGASFDTTYQYVFGCDNEKAEGCPGERGLYPEHNNFSIDAFTLSLEKEADSSGVSLADKVGFRADILFGEQAERLGFGFNSDGDGAVSPYQAYISIAPSESVSIYAGQFTTLAGWELIEAKDNTNISRSLLFYRIPFAHSGARVAFSPGNGFDLTLGISNDWDAVDDVDDGKTFEFQAAYSHSSETGLINDLWLGATAYVGKSEFLESNVLDEELNDDNFLTIHNDVDNGDNTKMLLLDEDNKTRTLVTLVGSITSGKFTFISDAEFTWVSDGVAEVVRQSVDIGNDDDDTNDRVRPTGVRYDTFFRWGVGGYLIYQATPDVGLSLRAEYVDDSDTANDVKLFEVTPTVSWKPFGENELGTLETRFEYRWDRADKEFFNTDKGLERDQHALLFQLLYRI